MTTWSTTDKTADMVLSGGDLVVTSGTGGPDFQAIRSSTSRLGGKRFFELTLTTNPSLHIWGDATFGLATAVQVLIDDALHDTPNFTAVVNPLNNSQFYVAGSQQNFTGTVADDVGSTYSFAVDLTNGLLWYSSDAMRAQGIQWNWDPLANPETNIGWISLGGLSTDAMFAWFQCQFDYVITANFGATVWKKNPPATFFGWDVTTQVASAAIDGVGTIITDPSHAPFAEVVAVGTATITVDTLHNPTADILIAVVGSVSANAAFDELAEASIAGVATVFFDALIAQPAEATIAGEATIVVDATIGVEQSAEALIAGEASVEATAQLIAVVGFHRASTATYFDETGTLQTADVDVERFGWDMNSLLAVGTIIEEATTNYDRNPSSEGGNPGDLDAAGVAPTNHIVTAPGGISRQYLGNVVVNGIPCARWRFLGFTTDINPITVSAERGVILVSGLPSTQKLSASLYMRLVDGIPTSVINHWGELLDSTNVVVPGIPLLPIVLTGDLQRYANSWFTPDVSGILA